MASHLAAQDYLARLQASGLNFPMGGPDPYAALGLPSLASMQQQHNKSKGSSSKSNARSSSSSGNKDKSTLKMDSTKVNSGLSMKYSPPVGLTIQPSLNKNSGNSTSERGRKSSLNSDLSYLSKLDSKQKSTSAGTGVKSNLDSANLFANSLSLSSSNQENSANTQNSVNSSSAVPGLPASILR